MDRCLYRYKSLTFLIEGLNEIVRTIKTGNFPERSQYLDCRRMTSSRYLGYVRENGKIDWDLFRILGPTICYSCGKPNNFEIEAPQQCQGFSSLIRYIRQNRNCCQQCQKLPRACLPHPHPAVLEALERLLDFLEALFTFLQQLLDELTYAINLQGLSREFPCNMRHPCTTMPWTIWPALVVLWGVCWMFYTPFELFCGSENLGDEFSYDATQDWLLQSATEPGFDSSGPSDIPGLSASASWPSLSQYPDNWPNGIGTFGDIDFNNVQSSLSAEQTLAQGPVNTLNLERVEYTAAGPEAAHVYSSPDSDHSRNLITAITPQPGLLGSVPTVTVDTTQAYISNELNPTATPLDEDEPDQISQESDPSAFQDDNLVCPHCREVFARAFTLQRHINENHAATQQKFYCPHRACKRSAGGHMPPFKRTHHLNRHIKTCKHRPRFQVSQSAVAPFRRLEALQPIISQQDVDTHSQDQRASSSAPHQQTRKFTSVSSNEQLIDGLKRKYIAGFEAWEAKKLKLEEDYKREKAKLVREKEKLVRLAASIKDLEEEDQEETN
ncbi:hypothetical protein QBC38DRAFT_15818 [Podospora fimiseda]|uniref:C2H2-type domain-containing protein n=1 Tax=Podospora fimiseda TaxID=252190 RepID=A0AAN7GU87_9PEZI|nr:hypothetical protein QBC38DRAFT_15818 [Podospora fimiseda]